MARILMIDDDQMMTECLSYALPQHEIQTCTNAIDALELVNQCLPDLLILDILLDGPDGFSLLNELITYSDTAKIPVIIVSSLDLSSQNLTHYGVVAVLQKETMTPTTLQAAVRKALGYAE